MHELTRELPTEDDTAELAQRLAKIARPGDCFPLAGAIGAGKSFFARAFIHAYARARIEVPSPTFTLVQTYSFDEVEIWHADLYRLSAPNEAYELGLIDAMENAICLIEWPDLLNEMLPSSSLRIEMTAGRTGHTAKLQFDDAWAERLGEIFDAA